MGAALGGHLRPLQTPEEIQIRPEKLSLVVIVVPNVVTIAAEIEPVDRAAIPEEGSAGLAAGPVGAAVMPVAGEELGGESAGTAVPGDFGYVRAEEGDGAAGLRPTIRGGNRGGDGGQKGLQGL